MYHGEMGSLILRDGRPHMLLFPGGFCTFEGASLDAVPHYYTADWQGSIRTVTAQDGTVEQVTNYYPFGTPYSDGTSTHTAMQPFKYGAKELDMTHGWHTYDFGARIYDPTLARWLSPDPMMEKYYPWSPYIYCGNDPVNAIDPDGKDVYTIDEKGRIIKESENDKVDLLVSHDGMNMALFSLGWSSHFFVEMRRFAFQQKSEKAAQGLYFRHKSLAYP